ncbi:hypothetical protein PKB_1467 [Pseudomonas knackmussii B13]|uniref:Water stress and hypersensitive response domain-containing protein n=1 Tax=Pseudomonas knackmussii (strain DSM 6978 / CCUG 54928 / LMG 23759 / B13) TaxID=1301098 RepID=A0A024HDY7_PSEKB|nr:LEA type 2 family protein [Pseudomonas knackmussii]CDF82829.1 hypothetical protein PKB_1467 [Pseudomonas knackmussii B13]
MNYQAQMIRIISLVWIFSLLSGCSWMTGSFESPDVKLVKVDVVKARLLEQQFMLHFSIDNPNDFSLPVRGLAYKVKLNDVDLAEGESSLWFTVPANGRQNFQVPVNTNLWRHMKYIVKLLQKPDQPIRYNLEGDIKTGILFGQTVHIARNGEIIPGDFIPE